MLLIRMNFTHMLSQVKHIGYSLFANLAFHTASFQMDNLYMSLHTAICWKILAACRTNIRFESFMNTRHMEFKSSFRPKTAFHTYHKPFWQCFNAQCHKAPHYLTRCCWSLPVFKWTTFIWVCILPFVGKFLPHVKQTYRLSHSWTPATWNLSPALVKNCFSHLSQAILTVF